MPPVERLHVHIAGQVQGVFFRAKARETAIRLGLVGWVRNTYDGSVEAIAEGERPRLEEFLTWCHRGPSMARVHGVEERWEPATGEFTSFTIAY